MWKVRKTGVLSERTGIFPVGGGAASLWKTAALFLVIRIIPEIPKLYTLQTHILWKTYPSLMRVFMFSIVSEKPGSSAIIFSILLQAEIAVVWSFRSNSVAIFL